MKKLMPAMIALMLVAGCHFKIHDGVQGSGARQTQKREVASFNSISVEGAFDIDVVGQQPASLEIEGDDNILPLVTTEVSNNVLRIKSLRAYSTKESVHLKITVPTLEGLTVSGAGRIDISNLKGDTFEIDAQGAPAVTASGEVKTVKIDASGAGKVDAHKLRAANAEVDAKGVVKVEVNATGQLNVTVSGPSHVVYEGNPNVNKTVHGPGSVEKKESKGPA
jgi:hypothetical protein